MSHGRPWHDEERAPGSSRGAACPEGVDFKEMQHVSHVRSSSAAVSAPPSHHRQLQPQNMLARHAPHLICLSVQSKTCPMHSSIAVRIKPVFSGPPHLGTAQSHAGQQHAAAPLHNVPHAGTEQLLPLLPRLVAGHAVRGLHYHCPPPTPSLSSMQLASAPGTAAKQPAGPA